jgi:ribonuclease HI
LLTHARIVSPQRPAETPAAFEARLDAAVQLTPPPASPLRPVSSSSLRWARRWSTKNLNSGGASSASSAVGTSLSPAPAAGGVACPSLSPLAPLSIAVVATLPLACDPQSFAYTDASQFATPTPADTTAPEAADDRGGGRHLGCGVFFPFLPAVHPQREYFFSVPATQSNIVRGELSAILAAIQHCPLPPSATLHILTDSLTALQLLQKHLSRPWLTASSPCQPLLQAICSAAAARSDGGITIQKVRAHSGVRGNEAADALAKAGVSCAAQHALPDSLCPHPPFFVSILNGSLGGNDPPTLLCAASAGAADAPERPASRTAMVAQYLWYNLVLCPQTALAERLGTQPSSPALAFSTHCAQVLHARPSKRLPYAAGKIARQARFGVYPGQHRLHLLGLCPSPACPLCSCKLDTGYHGLLNCRPPPWSRDNPSSLAAVIAGMVTLRHNAGVHLLADSVRRSSSESGCTLLVSAGKAVPAAVALHLSSLPAGAPAHSDNIAVRGCHSGQDCTVPSYLLPEYPGVPDLMFLRGWCPVTASESFPRPHPSITLVPAEVCYCRDDSAAALEQAMTRKWCKYRGLPPPPPFALGADGPASLLGRDLLAELRARGWTVLGQHADGRIDRAGPNIITFAIGATGQTLCCTHTALCSAFRVPAAAADLTLCALARHSISCGAKILRTKARFVKRLTRTASQAGLVSEGPRTQTPATAAAARLPVSAIAAGPLPPPRPHRRRPCRRRQPPPSAGPHPPPPVPPGSAVSPPAAFPLPSSASAFPPPPHPFAPHRRAPPSSAGAAAALPPPTLPYPARRRFAPPVPPDPRPSQPPPPRPPKPKPPDPTPRHLR